MLFVVALGRAGMDDVASDEDDEVDVAVAAAVAAPACDGDEVAEEAGGSARPEIRVQ